LVHIRKEYPHSRDDQIERARKLLQELKKQSEITPKTSTLEERINSLEKRMANLEHLVTLLMAKFK
jgi:chromosome condensin MukBEF ATPase and DNA-binding subunit MukB